MKKPNVPVRLALLTMLALIIFLAGCGRTVPVATKPTVYTQDKVQADEHWRDIAVDIANKVRDALVERNDLITKPIYVAIPNSRGFSLSFYQMLRSELVSRAIQVSEKREPETITLEYDVLTVPFDPSRKAASDNEIVVNVRMAYNNRYVIHRSFIRYINDADWALYLSPESLEPSSGKSRVIRVTNK